MRINHNMSAVITNDQLLNTEDKLAKSMERLSSGLRINHASDDPSGIAIAGKMTAQIDGLNRASRNSSDGISVIQTADGALNEVTSMIQRMRELAVQAANGTNSQGDKEAIQLEIDELKAEVDRISESTQFNGKNLLDGSQDARIYTKDDHASRMQSSEHVPAGLYKMTIDAKGESAELTAGIDVSTITSIVHPGTIAINGYSAEITSKMTGAQVYQAMREVAEKAQAEISDPGVNPTTITTKKVGYNAQLEWAVSNADLAAELGMDTTKLEVGVDPKVNLLDTSENPDSAFGKQATIAFDGNHATITDTEGFQIDFLLEKDYTGPLDLNVTDIGIMRLQIGANEGQSMDVRIPSTDCEHLYIDDVDVTTAGGAERAMDQLDLALSRITSIRSRLGAYENRLEHTTASLDETEENMTSALSRIEDIDMATEMVEYTKDNVLEQAGTSALSQANELPNLALQLLQK